MSDCTKSIRSAVVEDKITETQAKELLEHMQNMALARKADKNIRLDEALKEVAGELRAGDDALRVISKRNKLLGIQAIRARLEAVTKGDGVWAKKFKRELEGTWDRIHALEKRFQAPFNAKLEELGLSSVFRKQQHSRAFSDEAWNVGAGGTKPVTPGEIGQKIHDIMRFYVDARKQRNAMMNRRGAYFLEHDDYGFMQSYSRDRVRALGGKVDEGNKSRARTAFFDLVAQVNVNPKTYEGRNPSLFWSNVFDNLYSGKHIESSEGVDVDRFSGVHGSLANKISSKRLIWFADAESQWKWNQAIGAGDYAETMMREIGNAARSTVLMTDWGPNWKNDVELVNAHLQELAVDRQDSAKQIDALTSFNLKGYIGLLSGEADIPTRPTAVKWLRNGIAFLHTAKMGAATIASIPDVVMVNNSLAMNGMSRMERLGAQLDISAADKDVLHGLNVVSSGFIGSLQNRFGVGQFSGTMARASHALFQMNFFNRWNDMNQEVTAKALSWWMGKHSDLDFSNLPAGLREQMANADIRAADWDAIRSVAQSVDDVAGDTAPTAKKFVLLDKLDEISDDLVDRVIAERKLSPTSANRRRVRDDIDLRLSTYFSQQVDTALNVPDLATKYVTTFGGSQAGTLPRIVADLTMIFKSFPISVALRMKKRAEDAGLFSGAWEEKQWSFFWGQSRLIAATAVAGYIAMTTRDLLGGRTRRKFFDENGAPNASVFVASLAKGGGIGIFGDVLFSEYDRQYKSALNTFAGPAFGMVDQLGSIYTGARRAATGEATNERPLSELVNMAQNNIPFANLFYVKPILNHFVWYNIREMLSPGVLKRAEKSAREMNYQDFWIEPSEVAEIPITEPGRKIEALIP